MDNSGANPQVTITVKKSSKDVESGGGASSGSNRGDGVEAGGSGSAGSHHQKPPSNGGGVNVHIVIENFNNGGIG